MLDKDSSTVPALVIVIDTLNRLIMYIYCGQIQCVQQNYFRSMFWTKHFHVIYNNLGNILTCLQVMQTLLINYFFLSLICVMTSRKFSIETSLYAM